MKKIPDLKYPDGSPYTDRNSTHSYFEVYETEFNNVSDINLLEIGVLWGGGMKVWDEYFEGNNQIIGVDAFVYTYNDVPENLAVEPGRVLVGDSTNPEGWSERLGEVRFDYIIDDGDHTSMSQVKTFINFIQYLKPGGKYFIEDVASDLDLTFITLYLKEFGYNFKVYDLRSNKGRFDDIMVVVYN